MLPPRHELMKLVETAMLEKAPRLHARLQQNGTLTQTLASRAEQIAEDFLTAEPDRDRMVALGKKPYLAAVSDLTQETRTLLKMAIEQNFEFADAEAA